MDKNKLVEVLDILDKLQFFQGSRAGRELWAYKSKEIQDLDLSNFNRDINIIRNYINSNNEEKELK